jgi:NTE family protein
MSATATTQAADGIFSGGGIKGLAFAGALKAAEEAGYKEWVQLAGTSAGAITAAALATGYDADGLHELFKFDFSKIDDRLLLGLPNYFGHGLTKGKALTRWIEDLLKNAPQPASTFRDLNRSLQVIGADIVHSRMVIFPQDAPLYLDKHGTPFTPEEFPLATAVRISAGFPGFFPPISLKDAATGKDGALVDGGVTSGFRSSCSTRLHRGGPPGAFACTTARHLRSRPTTRSAASSGRSRSSATSSKRRSTRSTTLR